MSARCNFNLSAYMQSRTRPCRFNSKRKRVSDESAALPTRLPHHFLIHHFRGVCYDAPMVGPSTLVVVGMVLPDTFFPLYGRDSMPLPSSLSAVCSSTPRWLRPIGCSHKIMLHHPIYFFSLQPPTYGCGTFTSTMTAPDKSVCLPVPY